MRVPEQLDLSTSGKTQDYKSSFDRFQIVVKRYVERIANILNGQVWFGDGTNLDNMRGRWINTTTPVAANTDFTVAHNLGRVPVGWLVFSQDKAGSIYLGTIVADNNDITLKASASSMLVRLFIV